MDLDWVKDDVKAELTQRAGLIALLAHPMSLAGLSPVIEVLIKLLNICSTDICSTDITSIPQKAAATN